jgi:hypothetical protein
MPSYLHTWKDALEQLDAEQQDALTAFAEGRELSAVGRALHREEADAASVLGEALVYLGNRFRDQSRAERARNERNGIPSDLRFRRR